MAFFYVPGVGYVNDAEEGAQIPHYGSLTLPGGQLVEWGNKDVRKVPTYNLSYQFGAPVQWEAGMGGATPAGVQETAPGYINRLLQWAELADAGQLKPYEQEQWEQMKAQALAVPTRDVQGLRFEWAPSEEQGWQNVLGVGSPDLGAQLLGMRQRMIEGTATPHERALYNQIKDVGGNWDYRASVPQASDVGFGLGDNLTGALFTLALGATGGMAAAPLAAGGASLATTLGSLGTLAGIAGTGAGILGSAIDQPWLRNVGLGLGIAGGLAGGAGGLANLWSSGVNTLSDAARLASSAGKVTGALGRIPGADPLQQAGRYLSLAGQVGQGGSGVANLLGAAQGVTQGATEAATQAVSDTGGRMADFDWLDFETGPAGQNFNPAWDDFLSWGGDETQMPWYQGADLDTSGGGGWLSSLLGGLGGLLLGRGGTGTGTGGGGGGLLGPLLSGLGSLGGGLLGSNASNEAARLQAQALNRGLDLQTAQWLQQQAQQAPWLAAGQQALPELQRLAGQGQPTFQPPDLPGTQPFEYSGPAMPEQGFQYTGRDMPSTGFQYTGPGMPETGFQYTGPGMPDPTFQYTNQMPTQDFQAPTFEALKARDPGIQARLDEARNALEASALARGSGMSGATLGALQRQSQTLASQEYQPAYQRALGEYQQEYGQDWQRQQEAYKRAAEQNQQLYGRQYQQQADIYGRQLGENQQAYNRAYQQQGDIYGRQLAENQLGYNRQWQQQMTDYERQLAQNQLLYGRGMEQYKLGYGQQAALNEQDYARNQARYQQQYQQMQDAYNAQRLTQGTTWNRYAALAGLGQTAAQQLGTQGQAAQTQLNSLLAQLGSARALGPLGSGLNWQQALKGGVGSIQNVLRGLNT